jgi:S1-C subfamily serine protease
MEEISSAVALSERPAHEPFSTSPFPPPAPPPLYPPGDFYIPAPAPSPKRRKTRLALVALFALVAGTTAGVVVESQRNGSSATKTSATTAITPTTPTTAPSTEPLPTVAAAPQASSTALDTNAIVALVDPAVVDITTRIVGGEAAGTGMVLTASGLVLTNNHVIDGATAISVQIAGSGPSYTAHVVGYDVADDIALIQIEDVSGLATITAGDSTTVAVGDRVVTIGNALGSAGPHGVSSGSVDALDQTITANDLTGDSESIGGLIQFDATIQPGDSGGPLVNDAGQVIGMNTAASVGNRRGLNSTAGYAIPIAKALDIAQKIQDGTGSATVHIGDRAIMGVEIASSLDQTGARVAAVSAGSPAAAAGIVRGDTITAINGTTISSVDDVGVALFTHSPGDEVQVTWTDTGGTSHTATLQLIAGPPA